jgi:hypothetical protein
MITNCISALNKQDGFSSNDNDRPAQNMVFYNNTSYYNGRDPLYPGTWYGYHFYSNSDGLGFATLKNNIAYANDNNTAIKSNAVHTNNSWDITGLTIVATDFLSLDSAGLAGARTAGGYLPTINFLRLSDGSQAINRGTNVGIAYTGSAPDLGAFEWDSYTIPPPLVSTNYPTIITSKSIATGGFIIEDYDEVITTKGICWNTTGTPDIGDNIIAGGSGSDAFTVTISGLAASTVYYIRAYATTVSGTGYGSTYSITTDEWNWVKNGTKINTHLGKPVIIR